MFRKNDVRNEQRTMFSKTESWTEYQKKRIIQGWPELFRTKIMPYIDEEPYAVLYSTKGSRPNTPVNFMIGILILKSLLGLSDEEVLDAVLFNEQVQYALGTIDYEEQPISKNMTSNFRMKLFNYEQENGINLFENTLREINEKLLELSKIDRSLKRADSLMISSSCKKMTRTELVYKVNEKFIKMLDKKGQKLSKEYKKYLEEGNAVDVLYKTKETEISGKLTMLLEQSLKLYKLYKNNKEINNTEEFFNLERLIHDQYDDENQKPKEGKKISPTSMQTPFDKEATYRFKYQGNIGYVGNIVEAVDEEKELALITDWEVAPNVKSDKEFMEEMIEKKEDKESAEKIVVDAAYYSAELKEQAEKSNIEIHPTDMTGQKECKETNLHEFEMEENVITKCPMKEKPVESKYCESNDMIYAEFEKEKCECCSKKELCPIKILKEKSKLATSKKKIEREKLKAERNTEEYKEVSHIRSGIEGIPSVLRRKYNIDNRGSKGLPYLSMLFSASILSINIKRTVVYQNRINKNNENVVSADNVFEKICYTVKSLKIFFEKMTFWA